MNISEEIYEIRTGLRDAEQSLRHLSLRLDRVEAVRLREASLGRLVRATRLGG